MFHHSGMSLRHSRVQYLPDTEKEKLLVEQETHTVDIFFLKHDVQIEGSLGVIIVSLKRIFEVKHFILLSSHKF